MMHEGDFQAIDSAAPHGIMQGSAIYYICGLWQGEGSPLTVVAQIGE